MKVDTIPRCYEGCKIVVAAIGPSLTTDVIETVRKYKDAHAVLGINDAYKVIDFMDEFYACDGKWWRVHGQKIKEMYPNLSMWCHDEDGKCFGAKQISGKANAGLSEDPSFIHTGSNSGYQALNLATLWGCRKIILVGYNMGLVGNKRHFFGNDRESGLGVSSPYPSFVKKFSSVQSKFKEIIVNCTENSQLTAFRKGNLEEELNCD